MDSMKNKNISLIIQARTKSTRLPNKVLADIGGRSLIEFQIERLKRSKLVTEIIIATSDKKYDDPIETIGISLGLKVVRGDEEDVLSRFVLASKNALGKTLIRITADCPLIDPELLDQMLKIYISSKSDYLTNTFPPTYPDGLDIEIFSSKCLEEAHRESTSKYQREHVTPWIKENKNYLISNKENQEDFSSLRWTVDEPEDLEVMRNIIDNFNGQSDFSWEEVIELEKKKPEIFKANKMLRRNEGSIMSSGQKLWRRAKKIIPGGNMLLSKRPELYLPGKWPTYFSKASGCEIWDLDGNHFFDISNMGVGTNILGYSNQEVNEAVANAINLGTMSSLNCPEEVYLAEKLVEMHNWANMVRFARSGGEANSIAIRIARASTGRDDVAICGYHGWHDWYLATNLENNSGLEEHLLPGLDSAGVPKALTNTVHPFSFNKYLQLEDIASKYKLAAVKMEVHRSDPPKIDFLKKIRELCTKKGIVLIFDECTSGFRETFGGIHKKYEVNPDMAMFGKALGNGYPITAVIGKRAIMEAAQTTFISSTFWTDRVGPVAALKTLELMEKEQSWDYITKLGIYLQQQWEEIANLNNLKINLGGLPALANFKIETTKWNKYKTYISQEMMKVGFLSANSCYLSTKHSQKILERYLDELNRVFQKINKAETDEINIDDLLEGEICHDTFRRLT